MKNRFYFIKNLFNIIFSFNFKKGTNMKKRKTVLSVNINGKHFNTITEAAKAINCKAYHLYNAYASNATSYKNFNLEFIRNENDMCLIRNRYKCPVICTTTGKVYDSIADASKAAGANNWTMSLKMEKAGKFIDKEGNEYIRKIPMNTSREYSNQTPTVNQRLSELHSNSRKSNNKIIKSKPLVNINKIANSKLSNEAITVLKNVTNTLISSGNYSEAKALIDVLIKNS